MSASTMKFKTRDRVLSEAEVDEIMVNGEVNHGETNHLLNGHGDAHGPATVNGFNGKLPENINGLVNDRIKRKAKRLIRVPSKDGSAIQTLVHFQQIAKPKTTEKNRRRPRNGFKRGQPKKGGAGGKGVWGHPGSELDDLYIDEHDPNYDSDSLDSRDIQLQRVIPELAEDNIPKTVEPIILEYFEHGDTNEVAVSLDEFNFGAKRYMIVQLAVELALDRKPSQREMTSVLISDLYGRSVSGRDIDKAFEQMVADLPDLILDTPDAATVIGSFMARAIADDCLAPRIIKDLKKAIDTEQCRETVKRAESLLSQQYGWTRLDSVWGVGGGQRPVVLLTKQMNLLLREYLSSGDPSEAVKCVQELEVPHFHHELVYEAVVMAIESINETTEHGICRLLKFMLESAVLTIDQMEGGFLRVFDDMPDICLDVPAAYGLLERFAGYCQANGILTEEIIKKVPSRGRKRFVSEGDGGRVKEMPF